MKPLTDCRLYTFVDTAYLRGRAPELLAQQLCDGGSDLIQLRAKNSAPDEIRRMAQAILPVTRRAGVGLVINDHLEIAAEVGAEICHLGQEDFFDAGRTDVSQLSKKSSGTRIGGNARPHPDPVASQARHKSVAQNDTCASRNVVPREREKQSRADLGKSGLPQLSSFNPEPLIGLSTHSPEQAQRALAAGPAYIAIGPVYATGTKPTAKPVTLEYVRWAAKNVSLPWFAIGGINLENLGEVLAAGARRVCVVSAILNAPDTACACREFKKRLG